MFPKMKWISCMTRTEVRHWLKKSWFSSIIFLSDENWKIYRKLRENQTRWVLRRYVNCVCWLELRMKTETRYMENEIINAQITVVMATITFYLLYFCFVLWQLLKVGGATKRHVVTVSRNRCCLYCVMLFVRFAKEPSVVYIIYSRSWLTQTNNWSTWRFH